MEWEDCASSEEIITQIVAKRGCLTTGSGRGTPAAATTTGVPETNVGGETQSYTDVVYWGRTMIEAPLLSPSGSWFSGGTYNMVSATMFCTANETSLWIYHSDGLVI